MSKLKTTLRCASCGREYVEVLAVTAAGGKVKQIGLTLFIVCRCGKRWSVSTGERAGAKPRSFWGREEGTMNDER